MGHLSAVAKDPGLDPEGALPLSTVYPALILKLELGYETEALMHVGLARHRV